MKWLARISVLFVVIILSLLIFLCFFQFPSMDDYVGSYLIKYYGSWSDAIAAYLTRGNGRYASIPLFLGVSASPGLMDHYGLVLVFFILLTVLSVYAFLRTVNRQLFSVQLSGWHTLALSGLVLVVFLSSIPEVASFLFWMATSTTYLISLCVFLFLIRAYLPLMSKDQKNKWGWLAMACLLTIIAAGCNEVILFYSFALPVLLFITARKTPVQVWLLIGFNVLLVVLITQIPGLKARSYDYTQKQSILFSAVGGAYRSGQGLLYLFSNPLFYISCFGVFILSGYLKPIFIKRTHWLIEAALLLGLIFSFHFVVRQFGGEIVPERAINIINCITIIGFWFIILVNGRSLPTGNTTILARYFFGLFIVALAGSSFTANLIKNVIAAPVHARVLNQRVLNIAEAKNQNRQAVVIEPYQIESGKALEKWFPAKKKFIEKENFLPPSFSYFMDEPNYKERAYFYAEYYGIDTIISTQGKFTRWSLIGNGDPWQ